MVCVTRTPATAFAMLDLPAPLVQSALLVSMALLATHVPQDTTTTRPAFQTSVRQQLRAMVTAHVRSTIPARVIWGTCHCDVTSAHRIISTTQIARFAATHCPATVMEHVLSCPTQLAAIAIPHTQEARATSAVLITMPTQRAPTVLRVTRATATEPVKATEPVCAVRDLRGLRAAPVRLAISTTQSVRAALLASPAAVTAVARVKDSVHARPTIPEEHATSARQIGITIPPAGSARHR